MQLKPGLRLESATCDAQVVVVKAPKDAADVDVRCGGEPMREVGAGGDRLPVSGSGDPTLLGKRYADDDLGLDSFAPSPATAPCPVGDQPSWSRSEAPALV
ncbi:MAG: hypothetical protein R2746_16600 [Acidimicrobiales bacterium]